MKLSETIARVAAGETYLQEDVNLNIQSSLITEAYDEIPTIDDRLGMAAEAVPIAMFSESSNYPTPYGIGLDVFGLYMERNGINDIQEAMTNIAEANHIETKEISLVFESSNNLVAMINEAKKETNAAKRNKKLRVVSRLGHLIDNLKGSKISLLKEPSKGVSHVDFKDKGIVTIDGVQSISAGYKDTINRI